MCLSPLTRAQAVVHANVWLIKKASDGSKILAMVLQSHFKHGGQNTHSMISSRIPVLSFTSLETFFFSGKYLLLCILSSMFEMWLQYHRLYFATIASFFDQPHICMHYSLSPC